MTIYNYIQLFEHPEVYSPQEDTFFFTDVLINQFKQNKYETKNFKICEIGVGTGYISIALSREFPSLHFVGIDISTYAIDLSYKNMRKLIAFENFSLLCMNLLHAFNPLKFTPEVIFFNPPYVRTSEKELTHEDILVRSWAGGNSGITIISEFLEYLTRFSFEESFFLTSDLNENELFESQFSLLLKFDILAEKKVENERLICYKVQKL